MKFVIAVEDATEEDEQESQVEEAHHSDPEEERESDADAEAKGEGETGGESMEVSSSEDSADEDVSEAGSVFQHLRDAKKMMTADLSDSD